MAGRRKLSAIYCVIMWEWVCVWVSERVSERVSVCEWVSEWVGEWVSEWVSEWVCVCEWVSEWVGGWVSEWVSLCVCVSEASEEEDGRGGGGGGYRTKNKNPTRQCGEQYYFLMSFRYIPIKYNTYDIYSVCIHIQLIIYTQHQIICAYTVKANQTYIFLLCASMRFCFGASIASHLPR